MCVVGHRIRDQKPTLGLEDPLRVVWPAPERSAPEGPGEQAQHAEERDVVGAVHSPSRLVLCDDLRETQGSSCALKDSKAGQDPEHSCLFSTGGIIPDGR